MITKKKKKKRKEKKERGQNPRESTFYSVSVCILIYMKGISRGSISVEGRTISKLIGGGGGGSKKKKNIRAR